MRAIVLAAGEGTRMRPLTANRPKVLLPVAGETLLGRILRQLAEAGVTRADVVVHAHEDLVRAHVGDGGPFGLRVECHRQERPRGSGDAVLAADPPADEPVLILNGDVFLPEGAVPAVVDAGPGALAAHRVPDPRRFGVFRVDDAGRAVEVVEKSPDPPSDLANAGVYHAPAGFAQLLRAVKESPRGEIEITDALNASFREHGAWRVVELEKWLDVGRPWDLLAAVEHALASRREFRIDGKLEAGATLVGAVHVGEGSVVKAGAYVEGPVYIGPASTIGPNCHVRPNTAIESGCKVGNACEVKASVLMEGTHVGHLSYVGDSVLGARVNFGAGTKVANLRHDGKNVHVHWQGQRIDTGRRKFGVVCGDDVHTGINSSLNVGVVLAAGSATAPGQVVMRSPE